MIGQLDLFTSPEPRPLAGRVTPGWHAWARMQHAFRERIRRAAAGHRRRAALRQARTALVHSALRGAV